MHKNHPEKLTHFNHDPTIILNEMNKAELELLLKRIATGLISLTDWLTSICYISGIPRSVICGTKSKYCRLLMTSHDLNHVTSLV